MVARSLLILATALCSMVIGMSPASADRDPTPAERVAIENVLRGQGYQSWREVKFADDGWDIDAARTADGKRYDLKLDPKNLAIIEKEEAD